MDITADSLSHCLMQVFKIFELEIDYASIVGLSGLGSRFTLSMNIKTGREIGHPSSIFCWDIISVAEASFHHLGLDWHIYTSSGYFGARGTATQTDRVLSNRITIIDDPGQFLKIDGICIFPDNTGRWLLEKDGMSELPEGYESMPFGPIIIKINKAEVTNPNFPYATMNYLIKTIERGEEPMEVAGKGNYSAVSGWKAFARWMQSFSIPLHGIRHEFLDNLAHLLLERRIGYYTYWKNLSQSLQNKHEIDFCTRFSKVYQQVSEKLQQMIAGEINYQSVKDLYFTEQKTQPIFKELKHYLKNEVRLGRLTL